MDGGSVARELGSLGRSSVWLMMLVAALGVASIFAVYTFIGAFVTDVVAIGSEWIPVALTLFGIGMTAGNLVGGKIADVHPARGIVVGFGSAIIVLAILASFGSNAPTLFVGLFCVGATMMTAIPTIQVRLTRLAPEAPTLMGAMNSGRSQCRECHRRLGGWAGYRQRLRFALGGMGRVLPHPSRAGGLCADLAR